jgi:uroporphyrinogen decarboxylase
MDKRAILNGLVSGSLPEGYRPAAFFLHFDPSCHSGPAAVARHVEYFRFTGMDFVKIQYERNFPKRDDIVNPADWSSMVEYGEDFYRDQLDVVAGIVADLGREAMVVVTLYSPFMCAGQTAGNDLLDSHLAADPDSVLTGLRTIRKSLERFVEGCVEAGVDGFYASTQGGEAHRIYDPGVFDDYIRPVDLELMDVIDTKCRFNILHVCDYWGPYRDLSRFVEYPGAIVSAGTALAEGSTTGGQIGELFRRPFLGGMDRHGVIASGSVAEVEAAARKALDSGPDRHCLGASCTLPPDAPWENLKTAIDTAHTYRR